MQQQLQLQINQPCHENWDKMMVHQQGRFCGSCQKMVVDFTAMSDEKLLAYFKNYDGNTCGRFEDGQLNRPLLANTPTKTNWQKWTFAMLLASLLLANKAKAQGKTVSTEQVSSKKIAIGQSGKSQEISGKVLDENGNGIPYASVLVKNENWGTATDSLGNFRLVIKAGLSFAELKISSVGYENKDVEIDFAKARKQVIVLKTKDLQDGVVVIGYGSIRRRDVTGGAVAVVTTGLMEQKKDTLINKDTVVATPPNNSFKIYPNPAKAGSTVTLKFNEPNNYLIRLVNMNGQVLSIQNIGIKEKQGAINFNIPATIAVGGYFLQATSGNNQVLSAAKLIVLR